MSSAEPSVVFADMAARSVPDYCDQCAVEIAEGAAESYQIVFPPPGDARPKRPEIVPAAAKESDVPHYRVVFGDGETDHRYEGSATFTWTRSRAESPDSARAEQFVERAMRVVALARSEHRADVAEARADNLEIALRHSRQIGAAIGILMSTHKITETQAFELLRAASQRLHRKLRDIAVEVIEMGWLESQPSAPTVRHLRSEPAPPNEPEPQPGEQQSGEQQ